MTTSDRVWFWLAVLACAGIVGTVIDARGWIRGLMAAVVIQYTASLWAKWQVDRATRFVPNRRWWQ